MGFSDGEMGGGGGTFFAFDFPFLFGLACTFLPPQVASNRVRRRLRFWSPRFL